MRCVNIDWLELYVLEAPDRFPCNADYYRRNGYQVIEREYGTRVWGEMFTLLDANGNPFIEIRRAPLANTEKNSAAFMEPFSAHIRLTNRYCYAPSPIDLMRDFMTLHDYTLKSIYRIDICLDFTTFDDGTDPKVFMERYLSKRYTKINQAKYHVNGEDRWDSREPNSIGWGRPTSMITTKFYCKTLELEEVKDKPYIRYVWADAKLVDDPVTMMSRKEDGTVFKAVIWRVEFTIKSKAAKWYVVEDCTRRKKKLFHVPHTLDLYDTREKLLMVFASLAHHYFHFKVYEEGVRKDRCKDRVTFKIRTNDVIYKPITLAADKADNRTRIMNLITRLKSLQAYITDPSVFRSIDVLIKYLYDRLCIHDANSDEEAKRIREVHRLFMNQPEEITDEYIDALGKEVQRQIELQFTDN